MAKREIRQNRNDWRKENGQWVKVSEANKFVPKSERPKNKNKIKNEK